MQHKIVIVDDDNAHRTMLKTLLTSWHYQTVEATDGDEAVLLVKQGNVDLVLSDVRMARVDGLTALAEIVSYNPSLPVILMTAYSSVETAVDALRNGAFDYLIKPLDFALLRQTLERALSQSTLALEPKELRKQVANADNNTEILARSQTMRDLLETISRVAPTEATVLICGESGTGKELVATELHRQSLRASKPLVVINCAALVENLLESELFGHEKGAFTGADKRRDGRFVQANSGTLFLDEIGEMPLALQAKLLRVLQQGEIQRIGSDISLKVDVRIIAATNRDLEAEVTAGRFRQDLYFRLNVIKLDVPPLRERISDIPLLAGHFVAKFAERNKKNVRGFTQKALDRMLHYGWPGNVRELENCVERAVILARTEVINEEDLPAQIVQNQIPINQTISQNVEGLTLDDVERIVIEQTLQATNDNKSETARRLGITRATLHSKLKKYQQSSLE